MEEQRVAVVIEDDDDIRGLLVTLLTQSGFEVHEAAFGVAGVAAVAEHDPVLITVDLGLPDIDGYEVTRRVRNISDAYVLMLTARSEEIDALMGLDVGADDYVVKPFRPRELRARVEALLRRPRGGGQLGGATSPRAPAPPRAPEPSNEEGGHGRAFELDGLRLSPSLFQVVVEDQDVQLTPTEFILLKTLLASRRIVRTKAELSRILRDEEPESDTFVSAADERSVEVHIGNLRRKLGDDPQRPRWVETVRGIGYRSAGVPQKV